MRFFIELFCLFKELYYELIFTFTHKHKWRKISEGRYTCITCGKYKKKESE